ncbi:MAG: hypothetical protein JWN70_3873 [Planctomycetaceae bacterium]|nr:hypothetical protein [Planctomycetaceae bacterium]
MGASWRISRRTMLKGLGTAIALPWMEAMSPVTSAFGAQAGVAPKRMAFIYAPNGMNMADWTPKQEGASYELPEILTAFKEFKDDMLVMSGLTLDKARANGDGAGDHARALSAFLTCAQPRKTHGADIKVGISVDQVAAQHVGKHTKFASLEIGCDVGAQAGNCDSGYSCAYSGNIAWRNESSPVAKEINPKSVFERLFGDSAQPAKAVAQANERSFRTSVLDLVLDDATRLQKKLGFADRRKLDEYLNSVREIEERLHRTQFTTTVQGIDNVAVPKGIPKSYSEHIELMSDMLALAFQTDTTRIATFVHANEGSGRSYPFIDVPEGHHDLSHHGNDEAKKQKIKKINIFHAQRVASLLEKLKKVKEGNGTLLDNTMLVYGSGIGDGNAHNHDDLPVLLFGKGGGTISTGRHVRYEKETPIANLYLSLLDRIGVSTEKLGDSTGKLLNLDT